MFNRIKNWFKKPAPYDCGNGRVDNLCRVLHCESCKSLRRKLHEEHVRSFLYGGHIPVGKLDTSNPPKGGGVVNYRGH